MASQAHTMNHPIPFIYRLTFHYLEPFFALGGVLQLYFTPQALFDTAMPRLGAQLVQLSSESNSALQVLYTQIIGGWLILSFNDAVTLRVFARDVKVWQYVLASHLISDIVYCWALWQDWGSHKVLHLNTWDGKDWLTILTTLPPMLVKVAFLLGLGVGPMRGSRLKDS